MSESLKDNKDNRFYQRARNLASKDSELESLKTKKLLQTWFPMETGLGWVIDERTGNYVIN